MLATLCRISAFRGRKDRDPSSSHSAEIMVRRDGHDHFLAVGTGLVEVTGDRVAIATDMAVAVEAIDEAKAEEARQRAEARLREKISDEEVASVNASLVRSLAQLHVKQRRRGI
jgi:F-type H+-transporting ATPase subunit epsilon